MTLPITKVTRLRILIAPTQRAVSIDFASGDYRNVIIDEYDVTLLQGLVDKTDRQVLLSCMMGDLERILKYRSD